MRINSLYCCNNQRLNVFWQKPDNLRSQKENKSISFTSDVAFQSPIKIVSKDTEKSLNLYMQNIIHSTVKTTDEDIAEYFTPIFKDIMSKSSDENEFYNNLFEEVTNYISQGSLIKSNNRKNCYAERTMIMLEDCKLPLNPVYLDIGCGNGVVTKSISESLNIEKDKIYGLETRDLKLAKDFNIIRFDGENIPKEIPKSDFVTLFTVLHHLKDEKTSDNLLKSIYKNMNNGGYLLIREHEIKNQQDEAFWTIVHDLNTKVMGRTQSDLNNGTLYKSSEEWEEKLKKAGFKIKKKWYDLKYNDQKSYFLLAVK